ncbi:MAG: PilZ domain-containing protein [Omnitrophica bacterium]|nr:PilZ domain-containing protein [Candidatus Omnitrophota bacterium]
MYKNERRMFDRFMVDFSAEIKTVEAQENSYGQCHDVSATGMGLFTEDKLIPNTKLELWLGVPNGHPPFHGSARVIWSKQVQEDKWRSGLEFEKVDFMSIRRIFTTLGQKA